MALLEIKDLTFSYPNTLLPALKNINLTIQEGDFVCLFGTTGSGKSTLLKLMKKEISPFGKCEGTIKFNNKLINQLTELESASAIGYVMQNPDNQIVTDIVYHELAFGLENLGIKTEVIRRRVGEMASFFGINDWFRKKTSELSGGEKQLLNLASIMVMQPKILLLDEPTSQLDPIARSEFIQTLYKINQELGLTIIIIEHHLDDVFPISNKAIVMDQGEIIANDTPYQVSRNIKHDKLNFSLPSPVRIFKEIDIDSIPLTVRDAKNLLTNKFRKHVNYLVEEKQVIKQTEDAIKLNDIWFRYEKDSIDILRGINLNIKKGEIFSLVGGNGSGKTTLLKVIAGLRKPYQGKVIINHKNIKEYKNDLYNENITLLPQNPQDIFIDEKVILDLKEVQKIKKYTDTEFDSLLADIDKILDIKNILEKHPYDLSGGEQQKVGLAKILLLKPKIILLDEPTKGLDSYLKNEVRSILNTLKQSQMTIVIVTHDIEFAAKVSDRVSMIFDGEIVSVETPRNFFSGNNFYTTSANRISRHMYLNAITDEDVISLALRNGKI